MFNWKMAYAPNYLCKDSKISSIADIKKSGFEIINAEVPGNFELDLMREGRLCDLYYSANTLKAQKLENMHVWYFSEIEVTDKNSYLHFEGIDTVSEIYINGSLVKKTDNMFIPYDVSADFNIGKNEVVVHILPTCIESGKYEVTPFCFALKYNYAALNIRKAAHMFGWDIMPRIVSAGLWKPVSLKKRKSEGIKDVYFITNCADVENRSAEMRFFINADTDGDYINDYSVRVRGRCGDSEFDVTEVMWNSGYQFNFKIDNAKFWFPKNYGEPSLYETEVTLLHKENIVDTYKLNVGIRTVELDISDSTSEDDIGEFCFKVNGRRIFAMGSNWVPLDAFHSQDTKRLGKAFEMLDDLGCNIVRCWGGNVYESDEFFDFCDRHGIMVWQDFAMGCGVYPQTLDFTNRFKEEAVYQIKRLRNHPSLALWAGDNECDIAAADWAGFRKNPSDNEVTRSLLKKLTMMYDGSRPYLPSSPYISEGAYKTGFPLPEDHLWGPRDYFKGDFYNNAKSRFASETGYQGFPSPSSLEKFLKQPQKIFKENGEPTDEYTVHAASPEIGQKSPYVFRIGLTCSQILKLFGKAEDNFSDLIKQSQISQAEAKKYFIEKFRLKKWYCTGIIWWNLLDGWPQISDAVVDYYFCKKLAYHYIKRSQTPLCLMFGEPKGDTLTLYAVNELNCDKNISYTITEMYSGDEIAKGAASAKAGISLPVITINTAENEQKFYLIEWTLDGKKYKNHYCTNLLNTDYKKYLSAIEKCGFDEFEGFI